MTFTTVGMAVWKEVLQNETAEVESHTSDAAPPDDIEEITVTADPATLGKAVEAHQLQPDEEHKDDTEATSNQSCT